MKKLCLLILVFINSLFAFSQADLTIISASISPTSINVLGTTPDSKITWSVSTKNIGTSRAKICKLGIYLSSSSSVLGTKVDESTIASPTSALFGLLDGDTDTDNGSFDIPSSMLPTSGSVTRYVHFVADFEGTVDEILETNNKTYKTISLTFVDPRPDFTITSSSISPTSMNVVGTTPDSKISWSASTKNIGNSRAPIAKLAIYMSTSSTSLGTKVDEKDIASPSNFLLGLLNGDTDTDNGSFDIPSSMLPTSGSV
uniref:CARDB domain-containing protein n=1 Tax=Maribellus sediminis TaxID=2696285 RepID=UPI001431E61E